MDSIFVTSMLNDKITIKPYMLSEDMRGLLQQTLRDKYEGICSYHGYIKPESIKVIKYSVGHVCTFSLNGDVMYRVQYQASVCNPVIGNVIRCRVVNMNKFGVLAEASTTIESSKRKLTVMDVIIPKNSPAIVSEIDLESVKLNDEVFVEIKGKKFELNDKKISIVGRIVLPTNLPKNLVVEAAANEEEESGAEVDTNDDDSTASDDAEHTDTEGSDKSDDEDASDEEDDEEDTDAENVVIDSDDEDDESTPVVKKHGGKSALDDDEYDDADDGIEDEDEDEDFDDDDLDGDDESVLG